MKPSPLYFEGTRWPTARVAIPADQDDHRTFPRIGIKISGKGRRFRETEGRGYWRSFPEIQTADEAVRWVQRYGDPYGELSANRPIAFTDAWHLQMDQLRDLAVAWDPPGADGVSRFSDKAGPIQIKVEGVPLLFDSTVGEFAPQCEHSAFYMLISAIDCVRRKVPMRRCEVCGHWFELRRSTGRVCSNACQIIKSSREKGIERGFVQEKDNTA
jgi:hypothetical protein